eukprot:805500-Pelagomonas_calceolata.AAC.1
MIQFVNQCLWGSGSGSHRGSVKGPPLPSNDPGFCVGELWELQSGFIKDGRNSTWVSRNGHVHLREHCGSFELCCKVEVRGPRDGILEVSPYM